MTREGPKVNQEHGRGVKVVVDRKAILAFKVGMSTMRRGKGDEIGANSGDDGRRGPGDGVNAEITECFCNAMQCKNRKGMEVTDEICGGTGADVLSGCEVG